MSQVTFLFPNAKPKSTRLTVQVVVVLQLVPEERARHVDLLTSNDGDLLAHKDLVYQHICPVLFSPASLPSSWS